MAELIINNITHFYKKNCALNNISTKINNGIVALIGPNGAGKTTFINIIVGLLSPSKGQVLFNNKNIKELKGKYYNHIGYCPQMPQFYNNFTAQQFMLYISTLKNMNKNLASESINYLLEQVNLTEHKNKKIGAFSGGMKQRLGIAQALLNNPELLILDEPTAGLDPIERIRFKNLISKISNDKIIILATHITADVENIANQVLLLKNGELVFDDRCEELLNNVNNRVWRIFDIDFHELKNLSSDYAVTNIKLQPNHLYEAKIVGKLPPTFDGHITNPTLEDAFLIYFGGGSEQGDYD